MFWQKQAWKLSAIKGEPNLSIIWEVRLFNHIWQKDSSCQKSQFKLDKSIFGRKSFSAEQQCLPKRHFWQKKNCPKSHFWLKSRFWLKEPILPKSHFWSKSYFCLKNLASTDATFNVSQFFSDIFETIWSSLNKFEQVWSTLNKIDPLWSSLN